MTDFFQISGIVLVFMDMLKIVVRNFTPLGPRCLRCKFEMLSGPAALEALAALMAFQVWSGVNIKSSSTRSFFLICFDMVLESLELRCLTTEVYCLLKPLDMSLADERYLPLNLMAWLLFDRPFLPFRFLINLNSLDEHLISATFSLHFVFL